MGEGSNGSEKGWGRGGGGVAGKGVGEKRGGVEMGGEERGGKVIMTEGEGGEGGREGRGGGWTKEVGKSKVEKGEREVVT